MGVATTVVITGATSGVGRATARMFAERGASIGLIARGQEALDATAREIEKFGARALPLSVDVADADAVEAAADRVEGELGPIDIWINDAMTSVFAPFWEIAPSEFRRVTEVTYLGVVNGTRAALRRMMPRDDGTIVQVGSALAHRGIPLQSAYCGAKHAIQGFHESVRAELLHEKSGVRVTIVQLPALNTPQFAMVKSRLPHRAQPVPPIYQPEVAAASVVWAAEHPQRRETWVGGSTFGTIVAEKFIAGLLDRYLGKTGFKSQQTDQPEDPSRPSNLWKPVPGDHGAHGDFDARAHRHSAQAALSRRKRALVLAGVTAGIAAAVARKR